MLYIEQQSHCCLMQLIMRAFLFAQSVAVMLFSIASIFVLLSPEDMTLISHVFFYRLMDISSFK